MVASSEESDIRGRQSSTWGRAVVLASLVATAAALARISVLVSEEGNLAPENDGTAADAAASNASEGASWPLSGRAELVAWFGWITAACTGLGVVPFLFTARLPKTASAVSNAIACGMMLAATAGLVLEGVHAAEPGTSATGMEARRAHWGAARTVLGVGIGMAFVKITEALMEAGGGHGHSHGQGAAEPCAACEADKARENGAADEEEVAAVLAAQAVLGKASWRRALLFFVVMAAHSLAEGIGLGVSFGGDRGARLGSVISTTLAVHNIPEGLAICLVMVPQGVSLVDAAAMAVLSSVPQPVFALPAFFFVDAFAALLPVGLGFAGGAMLLVALGELWPQAAGAMGSFRAGLCSAAAFAAMLLIQSAMHGQ